VGNYMACDYTGVYFRDKHGSYPGYVQGYW
jgi:hypothetical protein